MYICTCCDFEAIVYEQRFWIDDSSPLREPGHECARKRQRLDTAQKSGQNKPNHLFLKGGGWGSVEVSKKRC